MSMILEIAVPDGTDMAPADLFEVIRVDGNRCLLQRVFRRVVDQPQPKTLGISVSDSVSVAERITGG